MGSVQLELDSKATWLHACRMSDKPKDGLAKLREPFPDHQVSKLPKGTKAQNDCPASEKRNCKVCGGWHHPNVVHLDYVGHAALTDRLLDVDTTWSWEPMALTPEGLPRFDSSGGLWIRLTVCGVTRLGYGHANNKQFMDAGAREKEVIGDALRNAGMRFGAALDLWHKGELHREEDEKEPEQKLDTSDFAKDTGEEWLKKYDAAATLAEVTAVTAEIKKRWDSLKAVPGLAEAMRVRRENALARVRGYDNGRQPGQEG